MSDHYHEQRKEHFVGKTSTAEAIKDTWQTPGELFDSLYKEFNFDLDACASQDNNLCSLYFDENNSALTRSWSKGFDEYHSVRSAFINPPYSQTELFLQRAAQQAKQKNITVVALVNANTDTKWFSEAVSTANEVRLITGRIGFVKADGGKANGNTKGQCLIIWRGNCKTPCIISMINRDDLT